LLDFGDVGFVFLVKLLEGAVEVGGVDHVIDYEDLDFQTGLEAVDVAVDVGLGGRADFDLGDAQGFHDIEEGFYGVERALLLLFLFGLHGLGNR
jgi:hypothetical protein